METNQSSQPCGPVCVGRTLLSAAFDFDLRSAKLGRLVQENRKPKSTSKGRRGPETVSQLFFRPFGARSRSSIYPRLTPRALFLRRFAALCGTAASLFCATATSTLCGSATPLCRSAVTTHLARPTQPELVLRKHPTQFSPYAIRRSADRKRCRGHSHSGPPRCD